MQNVSLQQAVLDSLRLLPREQQQSVLDFVEFLKARFAPSRRPLKSLKGLWAEFEIDLAESDFAEARAEMWGGLGEDIEL